MILIRIVRIVNNISEWSGKFIAAPLLWGAVGVILYEVIIARLIFTPTMWAHELSLFFFGGFTIVVGAYALRYRAHVNIDFFYNRLSLRGKAILDVVTASLFFIFCGFLLWTAVDFAWLSVQRWEISWSDWRPPVWPIKCILVIGVLLILLQGIAKFAVDLFTAITGKGIES